MNAVLLFKFSFQPRVFGLAIVAFLLSLSASFAQNTVTGVVTGEDGGGLPGVTINVKGTSTGTVTKDDGSYQIRVAGATDVLVFLYTGYLRQEVSTAGKSTINIQLEADQTILEQVVVIGYGTVKKRDLTGSISQIDSKEITSTPSNNVLETLQGRIAGLDLTESDGQAGSGLSFSLRGNRSLNASNEPLILVDGIPYGSSLELNPNDIQSIEVLKDASATAIYGTRGANGVILVTTKKGQSGRVQVSLSSYYGTQSNSGLAAIQTGNEYAAFKREAFRTQGITDDAAIFNPEELAAINSRQYVDWMRLAVQDGSVQNHEISINGGNDKTTFSLSLGVYDEQGLFKNDALKRYNGSVSIGYRLLDNLKIGTKVFYTLRDNDRRQDPLNQANKINPFGKPYDEDGDIILYPVAGQSFNISPLVDEVPGAYVNNLTGSRIFNSSFLEWSLVKNLVFRSNFGFDVQNDRSGYYFGNYTIRRNGNGSQSGIEGYRGAGYTWENTLTYTRESGSHALNFLIGNSLLHNSAETVSAFGTRQVSETTTFYDLGANASEVAIKSGLVESALSSVFGRVNYKLLDRYLLTASLRADGSSVFADGHKWGYFPSLALGWRLSDEGFLKNAKLLSNLMLRVSYGVSGNSAIRPYQTLGGLGRSTYSFNETAAFGYFPKDVSNPDLTWEKTATANLGLDFGLLENRIYGSINVYQSKTKDLLLQRLLPNTSGYASVIQNIGKTQNQGFEVELTSVNVNRSSGKGFKWTSDLNFSLNREEIVQLTGGADRDLGNGWIVGQPTQVYYDYNKLGIWQLGEEDQAAVYGQVPGDIRVQDVNNDGKITAEADRVVVGTPRPDFSFGLNNTISFLGFDLSAFLYGRKGQMIRSEASGNYKIDGRENGPLVDYWTPENPTNSHPRPDKNKNQNSAYMSTLYYADGSFAKIKNITLGYTIPASITDRAHIANLRVYSTLRNFFTFSKMNPYDPERGGSLSFPMTKQLIFGLNVNF
ncbi:MAG: TonB-dependent receptor [Saprospiraceae bacterium]|nr:TonB-dependent receptor [Saprospiraceae bacterium]